MTGQAPATLDTPHLPLRLVAPEDAEATSAMMAPAVSRWLVSWPLPLTVAMARERIAAARSLAEAGQALSLAATARVHAPARDRDELMHLYGVERDGLTPR